MVINRFFLIVPRGNWVDDFSLLCVRRLPSFDVVIFLHQWIIACPLKADCHVGYLLNFKGLGKYIAKGMVKSLLRGK